MKKIFDLARQMVLKLMFDRRAISTLELFTILGISLILLGVTYMTAQAPITAWWNNKIMTQFPAT
jgi:hypothetical protein